MLHQDKLCNTSGNLKSNHSKYEDLISNGLVFKGLGYSYGPSYLKSRRFCLDFKRFLTKTSRFLMVGTFHLVSSLSTTFLEGAKGSKLRVECIYSLKAGKCNTNQGF